MEIKDKIIYKIIVINNLGTINNTNKILQIILYKTTITNSNINIDTSNYNPNNIIDSKIISNIKTNKNSNMLPCINSLHKIN